MSLYLAAYIDALLLFKFKTLRPYYHISYNYAFKTGIFLFILENEIELKKRIHIIMFMVCVKVLYTYNCRNLLSNDFDTRYHIAPLTCYTVLRLYNILGKVHMFSLIYIVHQGKLKKKVIIKGAYLSIEQTNRYTRVLKAVLV